MQKEITNWLDENIDFVCDQTQYWQGGSEIAESLGKVVDAKIRQELEGWFQSKPSLVDDPLLPIWIDEIMKQIHS